VYNVSSNFEHPRTMRDISLQHVRIINFTAFGSQSINEQTFIKHQIAVSNSDLLVSLTIQTSFLCFNRHWAPLKLRPYGAIQMSILLLLLLLKHTTEPLIATIQ